MTRALRTDTYEEGDRPTPTELALTVLFAADARLVGRQLALPARLVVGREGAPGVDLALDDTKVSHRHALFTAQAGAGAAVEDLDSKNGTFVGGARVRRRTLAPGDVVRIGETLLELGEADEPPAGSLEDDRLVGRSSPLRALLAAIDRVAPTPATVLISGETGVGKELVAERIHGRSRRAGPLIAVNCGAVASGLWEAALFGHKKGAFTDAASDAPGYFAAAAGGTLFLDEIGVLPLELQPKLLRVLESRELFAVGSTTPRRSEARVVAATNAALRQDVEAGRFRRDLYARLAEHVIEVPPLRRRRCDIPILCRHFLAELLPDRRPALTAGFVEALVLHDWPMNVRELRSVVGALALAHAGSTKLLRSHLPAELCGPRLPMRQPPPAARVAPTREELEALLRRSRGNVAQIAEELGRTRTQIYRWLAKHGLDAARYREEL